MEQKNNSSGELAEAYNRFVQAKVYAEPELECCMTTVMFGDLYNTVDEVYLALKAFIERNQFLEDGQVIFKACATLKKFGEIVISRIDETAYSDSFRDMILALAALSINYANLNIEEGKESLFMIHSKESFEKIRDTYSKIVDRLNLNMSTQELILAINSTVKRVEDTLKVLGMTDSLLSISEHYMGELRRSSLQRSGDSCKVHPNSLMPQEQQAMPDPNRGCNQHGNIEIQSKSRKQDDRPIKQKEVKDGK